MSAPQEDGIVRFGNHISLKHITTERFLTSREGDAYETGSGQQKIFTTGDVTEESTWIVLPPQITEEEAGYEVGFEDQIRLKHVPTRANLHSHELPSPITEQQEVSCFGDDENSDENDIWVVLQYDEDSEIYEDNFWHVDQPVIIRHVQTGKLLHSHEEALADGENEVTGYDENDDNSRWAAVSC